MRRHATIRVGTLLGLAWGTAGLLVVVGPPALAEDTSRTLLAVFAHPDDEQVVSPLLSRYAREGVQVHVAYATGGQQGVQEHAGLPAGEELARARAEEARCACKKLGIRPPVLMGLQDRGLATEENERVLPREIARLFAELKPDVVVTWGPDGVTGHSDHRIVSSVVSQLVQQGDPDTSPRLFYVGLPAEGLGALAETAAAAGRGMVGEIVVVGGRYLPVRVAYGEEDARAAREALDCHKSQYTPEEAAMLDGLERLAEGGAVHLRPWFGPAESTTDLFE